ncbi:MAG: hypothetical protein L3J14_00630 [Flavobacteriaceae bacterium]|nr:hypothetical protein [Flavobacteriaceae bacterium]
MRLKFETISNYKIWIKILLPSVFLLLAFYILTTLNFLKEFGLLYLPISFGLIIGISNWKLSKFKINVYKPFLAIFTSILISIISFFLGIFSLGLYSILENLLQTTLGEDSVKFLIIIFSVCLVAPLTFICIYRLIFNIPKTKFSLYVIISNIILLVLCSMFFWDNIGVNDSNRMLPYILWQIIMALALQLILYQNDLKMLFANNK